MTPTPEPIVTTPIAEAPPKATKEKKAKPTLAAMAKTEQAEDVVGEPVVEEVKAETQTQPEMKLPDDLQAKIDEANSLWEEIRQDTIRNNLHPDETKAKWERYNQMRQEAEDIANGYRQQRTMSQDGTQLGDGSGNIPPT